MIPLSLISIIYDVNGHNLHMLTTCGMSQIFDSTIANLKAEKKLLRICPKSRLENYESENHRLQYNSTPNQFLRVFAALTREILPATSGNEVLADNIRNH